MSAFGGIAECAGRPARSRWCKSITMKESHQHLMITAAEWEAFLDDLQQTLDKFAVPPAEQAEIKAIIASTRSDIVV